MKACDPYYALVLLWPKTFWKMVALNKNENKVIFLPLCDHTAH
jgi:hypothetical protein